MVRNCQVSIFLGYANVLRITGRNDQALAVMQQMVIHHPKDNDVLAAYGKALALAGGGGMGNLPALQQKMQSLVPVPPRELEPSSDPVTEDAGAMADPVSAAPEE